MKMYTHKQMAFGRVLVFVHAIDWVGFRTVDSSLTGICRMELMEMASRRKVSGSGPTKLGGSYLLESLIKKQALCSQRNPSVRVFNEFDWHRHR